MNMLASVTTGIIQGLSTDVLILIGAGILLFFYGVYQGTHKLAITLFAIYAATLVYLAFPYKDSFVLVNKTVTHVGLWLVAITAIRPILDRITSLPMSFGRIRSWVEVSLLTAAIICSVVVILYAILGFAAVYAPTLVGVAVLTKLATLFWVMLGTLIAIYFIAFL